MSSISLDVLIWYIAVPSTNSPVLSFRSCWIGFEKNKCVKLEVLTTIFILGHQVVPLALPYCLVLRYWYHQLVIMKMVSSSARVILVKSQKGLRRTSEPIQSALSSRIKFGQMFVWPEIAWCKVGRKTVLPKQNGLLTNHHQWYCWPDDCWSEDGLLTNSHLTNPGVCWLKTVLFRQNGLPTNEHRRLWVE